MILINAAANNDDDHLPSSPSIEAGALVELLQQRLAAVAALGRKKNLEGVRQVHQLRVATRRAFAVLAVCQPLLAKSLARRLETSLKRQRKALGAVRDWDVLISHVLCTPSDDKTETRCDLLLYLARERRRVWREARPKLRRAQEGICAFSGPNSKLKLARGVDFSASAQPLFHRALREPLASLDELESRSVQNQRDELQRLHALRIVCKQMRYLLELHDELAPQSSTANNLRLFTEAQQRLGDLHDAAQRPELLRQAKRPRSKNVRRWIAEALAAAESRLTAECSRYEQWRWQASLPAEIRRLAKDLENASSAS